jgi:hypothetical protein
MIVTKVSIEDPVYSSEEVVKMCNPPNCICVHMKSLLCMPNVKFCMFFNEVLSREFGIAKRISDGCPRKLIKSTRFKYEEI